MRTHYCLCPKPESSHPQAAETACHAPPPGHCRSPLCRPPQEAPRAPGLMAALQMPFTLHSQAGVPKSLSNSIINVSWMLIITSEEPSLPSSCGSLRRPQHTFLVASEKAWSTATRGGVPSNQHKHTDHSRQTPVGPLSLPPRPLYLFELLSLPSAVHSVPPICKCTFSYVSCDKKWRRGPHLNFLHHSFRCGHITCFGQWNLVEVTAASSEPGTRGTSMPLFALCASAMVMRRTCPSSPLALGEEKGLWDTCCILQQTAQPTQTPAYSCRVPRIGAICDAQK